MELYDAYGRYFLMICSNFFKGRACGRDKGVEDYPYLYFWLPMPG